MKRITSLSCTHIERRLTAATAQPLLARRHRSGPSASSDATPHPEPFVERVPLRASQAVDAGESSQADGVEDGVRTYRRGHKHFAHGQRPLRSSDSGSVSQWDRSSTTRRPYRPDSVQATFDSRHAPRANDPGPSSQAARPSYTGTSRPEYKSAQATHDRRSPHARISRRPPPRPQHPPSEPMLPLLGSDPSHQADVDVDPHLEIDRTLQRLHRWSGDPVVHARLHSFGIPQEHSHTLTSGFYTAMQAASLSPPKDDPSHFFTKMRELSADLDRVATRALYLWATDPAQEAALLAAGVPRQTLTAMDVLLRQTDLSYPTERFPTARAHRRRVIMHVGPTNSGKTHNALRALAGADTGIYAGPLRLLAHEIWERLNLGEIAPSGAEEAEAAAELEKELGPGPAADAGEPVDSTADIGDGLVVARRRGNPKYARVCNMLTGEEHKVVRENAALVSSTIEMISTSKIFDVAVIDEIQMIADPERGDAWTAAVLGLCAKELHLCGEETAVPLIEAMLEDTGDTLEVRRYERLTPLVVERQSLGGDLRGIRKGDCIVAFSRSNIFGLKRAVERKTGKRCAVVYGKLPPEVRSEQARLFNDPDSGYDVLIGSDAIGMGLNLKIKRIIFQATVKYDGKKMLPLSTSAIKQIAGRAGRFGLHEDDSGGLVTSLHDEDLPTIRRALRSPAVPLKYARLSAFMEAGSSSVAALPAGSSVATIVDAHIYLAHMHPAYRLKEYPQLDVIAEVFERYAPQMHLTDRIVLMNAPIPWGEGVSRKAVGKLLHMHMNDLNVTADAMFRNDAFLGQLEAVEALMGTGAPPVSTPEVLGNLEGFHRMMVLYMWLSLRNPVTYSDHEEVGSMKRRCEEALEWCLDGVSWKEASRKEKEEAYARRQKSSQEEKIAYMTRHEILKKGAARREMGAHLYVPASPVNR